MCHCVALKMDEISAGYERLIGWFVLRPDSSAMARQRLLSVFYRKFAGFAAANRRARWQGDRLRLKIYLGFYNCIERM